MNDKYPKYNPETMTKKQLVELVKAIDNFAPQANDECDEWGITIGEAVWRMLHDNGKLKFND